MCYETVNTPSKCSHNLWIIKVNKKPDITLPAVYHIFSYFDFYSLFPVNKI